LVEGDSIAGKKESSRVAEDIDGWKKEHPLRYHRTAIPDRNRK